ncbi:MAG: ABC transporter permease [Clostridia bacterium]|nr:ABC transporter permease [Clostridiales bacterium]
MFTYILRRLMAALPVIVGAIAVVFILTSVVPGDPAQLMVGQRGDPATIQKLREDLGLNRPLWQQFVDFFKGVMTLDLGRSYRSKMPVTQAIAERLPVTARLALGSMALAVVSGVTLGMLAALKQNSVLDYGSMITALIGISAPSFWVGSMLIFLFCVQLRWVPGTGTGDGSWIYMLLPVLTLGMRPAALIARLTRCGMLEVLGQDFIRTARAKGLAERAVIIGHALKNAMLPVVTVIGTSMAEMLGGAVVVERLFSLPGVGRLGVEAILNRDFPLIRGQVLFLALVFVVINLLVDLSYPLFDPRIRYGGTWRRE